MQEHFYNSSFISFWNHIFSATLGCILGQTRSSMTPGFFSNPNPTVLGLKAQSIRIPTRQWRERAKSSLTPTPFFLMITTLRWRIPLNRSCSIWAFIPLELSPSLTPIYFAMAISLIFKPSSVLLVISPPPFGFLL